MSFWLLDGDSLDSCITIRTAEINKKSKRLSVRAWAWIVSDSVPDLEAPETTNKAKWFLWIFSGKSVFDNLLWSVSKSISRIVKSILKQRRDNMSKFYTEVKVKI